MAKDPKRKLRRFYYPGGTMTATQGLLEYLGLTGPGLGEPDDSPGAFGRKRRARRSASGVAGERFVLGLQNGKSYSVRITGTHAAFDAAFFVKRPAPKMLEAYSELGTIYAPSSTSTTTGGGAGPVV